MPRRKVVLQAVRFGIEIEVEFPETEESRELIEKHRLIRGWEIDDDGSLDNGAEYRPKNSNHLHYDKDSLDQIKEIIGLIKAHKGHIRPTCGLHLHINMKQFTEKEIISIIKSFAKQQNHLFRKFNVLKSRNDTAMKLPKIDVARLTPQIIKKIKQGALELGPEYFHERHFSLNLLSLKEHGTLEFRLFNGTIMIRKIQSYIKWAIQFCIENGKHEVKRRKR